MNSIRKLKTPLWCVINSKSNLIATHHGAHLITKVAFLKTAAAFLL